MDLTSFRIRLWLPGVLAMASLGFAASLLIGGWPSGLSSAGEPSGNPAEWEDSNGVLHPLVPDPATLPEPVNHGPYVLHAWGSPIGATEPQQAGTDLSPVKEFDTLEEASALSDFWSPPYLPADYEVVEASGGSRDGRIVGIRLTYAGEMGPLTIVSRQPSELPIRIDLPEQVGSFIVETGLIGEHEAVLMYPGPSSGLPGPIRVRFMVGRHEFMVEGMGVPLDELTRVAESLEEGGAATGG